MNTYVFIAMIAILFIAYRAKKLGYFDKKDHVDAGVVTTNKVFRFTGRIDAPSVEDRIAARDYNLAHNVGINESDPHGGIYMTGAFDFTTDATGQVVVDTSAAIIHGSTGYTVHGDMHTDGLERQLTVKADRMHEVAYLKLTAKNGVITGRMFHGGGEWHVFGNVAEGRYA